MRKSLTIIMLLAAAMLPAFSQAQPPVNICDRTPQVRDYIMNRINERGGGGGGLHMRRRISRSFARCWGCFSSAQ